jgi:hypothetical protein
MKRAAVWWDAHPHDSQRTLAGERAEFAHDHQVQPRALVMLARENQVLSRERVVPMDADGRLPIVLRRRPDEHAGYVGARGRLAPLRHGVAGAPRRLSDACVDEPRETPRVFQETVRMSLADLRVMTSNQTIWTSDLSVASGDLRVASRDLRVATEAARKRRASWAFVPETPSVVRKTIAEPTADLRVMTSDRAFVWLSRIVVLLERAVDWSARTVVWFSETVVWFIQAIVWSRRTFPWFVPGCSWRTNEESRGRRASMVLGAAFVTRGWLSVGRAFARRWRELGELRAQHGTLTREFEVLAPV